jgi:Lrp/AsnC family transcriptional regulator, leucine-responsive regulatory protein
MKLDKKDKAIIKALEEDGRALIRDIAKKTGIPRDSVNYRIKKLRKEKVIKGFAVVCDTNKLGKPIFTWVNVQLQQFDSEKEKKFEAFLKQVSHVVYLSKVTGNYHYMFAVATKTIQDLDKTLKKILNKFPNLVKTYNTSLVVEEIQYDSFYRLID